MIGPLQAQQVVLRAVCYGAAEVRWVLERVETRPEYGSGDLAAQLAEAAAAVAAESATPASDDAD